VPPPFPFLLVVPAVGMDYAERWLGKNPSGGKDWLLSLVAPLVFMALFFPTQWFFAEFLVSPAADNRLFAGGRFYAYFSPPDGSMRQFWGAHSDPVTRTGLGWALLFGVLSARLAFGAGTGWLGCGGDPKNSLSLAHPERSHDRLGSHWKPHGLLRGLRGRLPGSSGDSSARRGAGLAEVSVRVEGTGVRSVTVLPVFWDAGGKEPRLRMRLGPFGATRASSARSSGSWRPDPTAFSSMWRAIEGWAPPLCP